MLKSILIFILTLVWSLPLGLLFTAQGFAIPTAALDNSGLYLYHARHPADSAADGVLGPYYLFGIQISASTASGHQCFFHQLRRLLLAEIYRGGEALARKTNQDSLCLVVTVGEYMNC